MIKTRNDLFNLLNGDINIGIELGVAKGIYSKSMIDSNRFHKVYGVDRYNDHHDTKEYINALEYIGLNKPYSLIRCLFEEALNLFPDNYFNFIYIDGYAHTGQEKGKTLEQWFCKLKKEGIFAGHDYHQKWPLTIEHVDKFAKENNLILSNTLEENYPSWYILK